MDSKDFAALVSDRRIDELSQAILKTPFWSRLKSSETNAPDVYSDLGDFFLPSLARGLIEHPPQDSSVTENFYIRISDLTWGPKIASWVHEAFRRAFDFQSRGAPQQAVHTLNEKTPDEAVKLAEAIGIMDVEDADAYKSRVVDATRKLLI